MCENASLNLILAIRFSRDLREDRMRRFVEGADRGQSTLFPECLEDWIGEDNPVRVIDVFVDGTRFDCAWVRGGRTRGHRSTFVSSVGTAERPDKHLRLFATKFSLVGRAQIS
jgi:hypothetical protein